MDPPTLPRPSPALRLIPSRALARGRAGPAIPLVLLVAVLLHLLVGAAFVVLPPAFLSALSHPAPPRQAEVELVQNNMPTNGDDSIGAATQTKQRTNSSRVATPPPPATARQQQAPEPPQTPNLPLGPHGDMPPPQPRPSPRQIDKPTPSSEAQQAHDGPHTQPAPPQPPAPDVRLSDSDEAQGLSGGDAEAPAAPDPNAHNRLPPYPTDAAQHMEQGTVYAVVNVNPDGTAGSVVVVQSSGWPSLDTAAVKAWQKWKFHPAVSHGEKVASQVPIRLQFALHP